jgi:CRP/FNR family transcriptional regulator, dissimilatory nitrate respiration regulator
MKLLAESGFPTVLRPCATSVSYGAAQTIFRIGSVPRAIHFVESGVVRLVRHGPQGEALLLHEAGPGEFFAEASLDSGRYHCDAVAVVATVLLRVAKGDLERLLEQDPPFARTWISILAVQLRSSRARVERLSLRGAEDRIRHLLWSEGKGPSHELDVAGSLKDMARRLGLTHETLYRTLSRMQQQGTLERTGMRLRLTGPI